MDGTDRSNCLGGLELRGDGTCWTYGAYGQRNQIQTKERRPTTLGLKQDKQYRTKNLENHKHRGDILTCLRCVDAEAEEVKMNAKREQYIKRRLKQGWKCTCKHLVHTERCALFPQHAGERRWPGKNTGVTEDDLDFLAKRQRRK